jgi:hypothetical protein
VRQHVRGYSGTFNPEVVAQLSNSASQLSIFPTTTLPFVILSVEKKAHARNPCSEQSFD